MERPVPDLDSSVVRPFSLSFFFFFFFLIIITSLDRYSHCIVCWWWHTGDGKVSRCHWRRERRLEKFPPNEGLRPGREGIGIHIRQRNGYIRIDQEVFTRRYRANSDLKIANRKDEGDKRSIRKLCLCSGRNSCIEWGISIVIILIASFFFFF